jgi:hypothetical protein
MEANATELLFEECEMIKSYENSDGKRNCEDEVEVRS